MTPNPDSPQSDRTSILKSLKDWAGLGLALLGVVPFWFGGSQSIDGKIAATLICASFVALAWRAGDLWRRKQLDKRLAITGTSFVVVILIALFVAVNSDKDKVANQGNPVEPVAPKNSASMSPENTVSPAEPDSPGKPSAAASPTGAASTAGSGQVTFLSNLRPVTNSFEQGAWHISNVPCKEALGHTDIIGESATYRLNGRFLRFKATFAVGDDASDTERATLENQARWSGKRVRGERGSSSANRR
jgi:hypothetical protein